MALWVCFIDLGSSASQAECLGTTAFASGLGLVPMPEHPQARRLRDNASVAVTGRKWTFEVVISGCLKQAGCGGRPAPAWNFFIGIRELSQLLGFFKGSQRDTFRSFVRHLGP